MAIGSLIQKVSVKKSILLFVLLWDITVPVDFMSGTIMSQQSVNTHSCEKHVSNTEVCWDNSVPLQNKLKDCWDKSVPLQKNLKI